MKTVKEIKEINEATLKRKQVEPIISSFVSQIVHSVRSEIDAIFASYDCAANQKLFKYNDDFLFNSFKNNKDVKRETLLRVKQELEQYGFRVYYPTNLEYVNEFWVEWN